MPKTVASRITMRDVAKHCGVSYQTVSRVINNHPYVSPEIRQRVLKVIKDLDYHPHHAARSLARARAGALAVVTQTITYYGLAQIIASIEIACKNLGYNLIYVHADSAEPAHLAQVLGGLRDYSVDGIITILPLVGAEYERVSALIGDLPLVQVVAPKGVRAPSVVIDEHYGMKLVTQHLIELGHRDIAEIRGPSVSTSARSRHEGWLSFLSEAGLTPGPSIEGRWWSSEGYAAAQTLLSSGAHFTGLVCANDQMALGAMLALREHGLSIPEDVSVIGYDDIPEAAYFYPPLTTVRVDYTALGEQVVEYLAERMEHPDAPLQQRVVYPDLVVRSSTRPLK